MARYGFRGQRVPTNAYTSPVPATYENPPVENPVDPQASNPAPSYQDISAQDVGPAVYYLPAPEPPRPELATSPEWLAFLNSLGLEQDKFTADIQRQRGLASSQAAQRAADIAAQGFLQRRNVTGAAETRGMARSGQLIRNLANQRAAEGRQQGQVQSGLASTLSGLESQLSQKLIDIGARRAQQELSLRAQGYS